MEVHYRFIVSQLGSWQVLRINFGRASCRGPAGIGDREAVGIPATSRNMGKFLIYSTHSILEVMPCKFEYDCRFLSLRRTVKSPTEKKSEVGLCPKRRMIGGLKKFMDGKKKFVVS